MNIEEERIEELAKEYEVDIKTVRKYANILMDSSYIEDDETLDLLLETCASSLNPIVNTTKTGVVIGKRDMGEVLTKSFELVFNIYDKNEIDNEVKVILKKYKGKDR